MESVLGNEMQVQTDPAPAPPPPTITELTRAGRVVRLKVQLPTQAVDGEALSLKELHVFYHTASMAGETPDSLRGKMVPWISVPLEPLAAPEVEVTVAGLAGDTLYYFAPSVVE